MLITSRKVVPLGSCLKHELLLNAFFFFFVYSFFRSLIYLIRAQWLQNKQTNLRGTKQRQHSVASFLFTAEPDIMLVQMPDRWLRPNKRCETDLSGLSAMQQQLPLQNLFNDSGTCTAQ
jgi:hypothetical protein